MYLKHVVQYHIIPILCDDDPAGGEVRVCIIRARGREYVSICARVHIIIYETTSRVYYNIIHK